MMAAVSQRRRLDLASGDAVLHLALGLLSAKRRLDALLDPGGLAARAPAPAARSPQSDVVLHFVLGLVAFARSVRGAVDAATGPESMPEAGADVSGPLREVPWR
jgi:hypothetical protein